MLSIFIENFNHTILTAPHLGFSSTNELIPNPSQEWVGFSNPEDYDSRVAIRMSRSRVQRIY